MKLSPRLEAIAKIIQEDPVGTVADIGTDHGYLPIGLIEVGGVQRAIASDLNPGPLESARAAVLEAGLSDLVDLRLGSGLETLAVGEAQAAVIAGMGGVLIASLMAESVQVARSLDYLVLQPMQARSELRQWLAANHYDIVESVVVREGEKFYEIMKVKNGSMPELSWSDIHLGYRVTSSEDYIAFIEYRIRVQQQVIEGLKKGKRWEQLVTAHEALERMKERLQDIGVDSEQEGAMSVLGGGHES